MRNRYIFHTIAGSDKCVDEYKHRLVQLGRKGGMDLLDGSESPSWVEYYNKHYLPDWHMACLRSVQYLLSFGCKPAWIHPRFCSATSGHALLIGTKKAQEIADARVTATDVKARADQALL